MLYIHSLIFCTFFLPALASASSTMGPELEVPLLFSILEQTGVPLEVDLEDEPVARKVFKTSLTIHINAGIFELDNIFLKCLHNRLLWEQVQLWCSTESITEKSLTTAVNLQIFSDFVYQNLRATKPYFLKSALIRAINNTGNLSYSQGL